MRPTTIRTLDPQASPDVSVVGDTYRVVVPGEQTGQAYAIIDMLVPPGGGPGAVSARLPDEEADVAPALRSVPSVY